MKRISINFFAVSLLLVFTVFMQQQLFGVEYKYYSKGKRDPFIPLITSDIKMVLGLEAVETVDDIKFEGIIFDPSGGSVVVLNGEIVKEGDKVYNIEIIKIQTDAVTLKIHDKSFTIGLIEEGGETIEE